MKEIDQHDAWRRLMEWRIKYLEDAVRPPRLRRRRSGKIVPAPAYEPGDREPLTRYLEVRLRAMELLFRLMLNRDHERAEILDVEPYESEVDITLRRMEEWGASMPEPDLDHREVIASIFWARVILLDMPDWPLEAMEGDG